MKPVDLAKIFPIQSIEENCLINGNGDVTFGFHLILPEAYTMPMEAYEEMQESYRSLFSRLPAGTLIHKQDFYYLDKFKADYEDVSSFTKIHNLKYLDQRPVLRHYSNIYFTISSKMTFDVQGTNNSFTKLSDFIFKKPFKEINKQLIKVKEVLTNVEPGLNSIANVKAVLMDNKKLSTALFDLWNLTYGTPTTQTENKSLQPWEIDNEFKIADQYVKILTLKEEGFDVSTCKIPKTTDGGIYKNGNRYSNSIGVPTSFTFPIGLGLPLNHVLNTTIEILDYDFVSTNIDGETRKYNILAGGGYTPAKNKISEMASYVDVVSKGFYLPTRTSVNLILHNTNIEKLQEHCALATTAFSNMNGSNVWIENADTANLFVASTPGNMKNNYRGFLNTLQQALTYFPLETHYRSDLKGNLLVDRFGNPTMVDMWSSPYITTNRNKLIFGPSGTGKSFTINGLIDESLQQGNHMVVLDVGGSYKKNADMNVGSLYFDCSKREDLTFNIFLCPTDEKGKYLYDRDEDGNESDDIVNFVYSIIVLIWKGKKETITKQEQQLLRKCIKMFYVHINETKTFPTLIAFDEYIPVFENSMDERDKKYIDMRGVQVTLDSYVHGEYNKLLNSTSNIDINKYKYIVFDVAGIQKNEDIRDIVSIIIIQLVLNKLTYLPLGVRKSFIIDEAIDFLMSGDMSDFIAGMYRKIRKLNGEVYLATQDISFLIPCPELVLSSIVQNSSVKILLNHSEVKDRSYPLLKSLLSFTDADLEKLDSLGKGEGYREFLIKMGNTTRVFRGEVSKETNAVYTTDPSELDEIYGLYEKLGNMGSAINQFVENKYRKYENG